MRSWPRRTATALGMGQGDPAAALVVTAILLGIAGVCAGTVIWRPFSGLFNAVLVCSLVGLMILVAGSMQFAAGNVWHPLALPGAYVAATLVLPLLYIALFHLSLGAVKPSDLTVGVPEIFALTLAGLLIGALAGLVYQPRPSRREAVGLDARRLRRLGRALLLAAVLIRGVKVAQTYGTRYGTGQGSVRGLTSPLYTLNTFAVLALLAAVALIAVGNAELRHRVLSWVDLALVTAFAIPTLVSGSRGQLLAPAIFLIWAHHTMIRRVRFTHVLAAGMVVIVVFQGVSGLRSGGSFLGGTQAAVQRTLGSVGSPVLVTSLLVKRVPAPSPFTNGSTYVAAVERQLPGPLATKVFGPPTGTGTFVFRKVLHYDNPNNGFAFALPSEGYLNFGLEGALLAGAVLGLLLGGAYRLQGGETISRARQLLYPIAMATIPETLRSDAVASVKLLLYPMLILGLAFWFSRAASEPAPARTPPAPTYLPRRRILVVTLVAAGLTVPALAYGLERANRQRIDRGVLIGRLSAAAGIAITPGPSLTGQSEIDWVAGGGTEFESLSMIVFTTSTIAQQLGTSPPGERDQRLLRRGRVVILYSHQAGAPDRTRSIAAVLRQTVPAG